MITGPRVVRLHLPKADPGIIHLAQLCSHLLLVRADDQQQLMFNHLLGDRHETGDHLV